MIETLTLENYRQFRRFKMHHLKRVNLLVGRNNSGKSSVLEAIGLATSTSPFSPWFFTSLRGEAGPGGLPSVRGLFSSHQPQDQSISIQTNQDVLALREHSVDDSRWEHPTGRAISLTRGEKSEAIPIHPSGEVYDSQWKQKHLGRLSTSVPTTHTGLTPWTHELAAIRLAPYLLTPEEDFVVQTLQFIEPNLERIGVQMQPRPGVVVRLKDAAQPVHLASFGDGTMRLLMHTLSLLRSKNGTLLIDEVDTGLHHSLMGQLWQLIFHAAERLNVQVFATTHSKDCWQAFAQTSTEMDYDDVSIQRIEPTYAVPYDAEALRSAADFDGEVR